MRQCAATANTTEDASDCQPVTWEKRKTSPWIPIHIPAHWHVSASTLRSTVGLVYPCSETRQCKHRHQRAWRCGTTQQVEQHTFLCSSLPPKKVNAAHRKGRTSAQVFYSMTGVKAGVQVQGMPER